MMLAWANTYIAQLGLQDEIEVHSFLQLARLEDGFCVLFQDHQPQRFLRIGVI